MLISFGIIMRTEIIVTDMSIDELFVAIQPDEKSRQEAIEELKKYYAKDDFILPDKSKS